MRFTTFASAIVVIGCIANPVRATQISGSFVGNFLSGIIDTSGFFGSAGKDLSNLSISGAFSYDLGALIPYPGPPPAPNYEAAYAVSNVVITFVVEGQTTIINQGGPGAKQILLDQALGAASDAFELWLEDAAENGILIGASSGLIDFIHGLSADQNINLTSTSDQVSQIRLGPLDIDNEYLTFQLISLDVAAVIPEPGSAIILASAFGCFLILRRKVKNPNFPKR